MSSVVVSAGVPDVPAAAVPAAAVALTAAAVVPDLPAVAVPAAAVAPTAAVVPAAAAVVMPTISPDCEIYPCFAMSRGFEVSCDPGRVHS